MNRTRPPNRNGGWGAAASNAGSALIQNPLFQTLGLGFLTYNFLPGASGAIDTLVQLLPVMVIGGGAVYAVSVLKK